MSLGSGLGPAGPSLIVGGSASRDAGRRGPEVSDFWSRTAVGFLTRTMCKNG